MFLAILRYKVSQEELEPCVQAHAEFLKDATSQNAFMVSGEMMPPKGSVVLSPLTRRGEFEEILRRDPFIQNDLVSYEIIAFDPSHFHPDFAGFIREPERETIELVPYTVEWERIFKEEAEAISQALGKTLLTIHHIGSTSIPGIVAKPIVDILPVVKNIHDVDRLTPALEALGYEARGEFGMPGRRFFVKKQNGKRTFNVHIFEGAHPDVERHLRFRDYLRMHPEDAGVYSDLKKSLVMKSSDDIERYCWGKDDLVRSLDEKALLWRKRNPKVKA
jgi:GrpB-like predicted nucleotidyltransferase (UPF0157 family)/uncharacterized protein YciI